MGLGDVGLAHSLVQGIVDVDQDVLAENLIIHLTGPSAVKGQTVHFTLFFTFGGDLAAKQIQRSMSPR